MSLHWTILTGEYPPQPGGVSDYTRLVTQALAVAGDDVQIQAPPIVACEEQVTRVEVRRLPDHFGLPSLWKLTRELRNLPPSTRVLVQYVPHAFGWKAMNIPFCWWLWTQRRRHTILVMFHEVATPWQGSGSLRRRALLILLAAITRGMAWLVARAARRIFISVPAWEPMLRPLIGDRPVEWLPVPSNMPLTADPAAVNACRTRWLPQHRFLVGHFGTFGNNVTPGLRVVLARLLTAKSDIRALCIGGGSRAFVQSFLDEHPAYADRLLATGPLAAGGISTHLAACDLLVQPFVDGVSTRRTSVMAALALGLPVVTNQGPLSEPLWAESRAIRLANSFEGMGDDVLALLDNAEERLRLGASARRLYRQRFDIEHLVAVLRADAPPVRTARPHPVVEGRS